MNTIRLKRQQLKEQNRRYGRELVEIPFSDWSDEARAHTNRPIRIWQSRDFAVHLWVIAGGQKRLTICRTAIKSDGSWQDGISWDDLQRLKSEAGFSDAWAVEVYPPDRDVVNVANMRHLWLVDVPPSFAWRKGQPSLST